MGAHVKSRTGYGASLVGLSFALVLGLTGCANTSTNDSTVTSDGAIADSSEPTSREVTRFEVTERLERVAKAVVDYTDADYGDEPTSSATLNQAQRKLEAVANERTKWDEFTSSIDYGASDIAGLESAVGGYEQGFEVWYSRQTQGLQNWMNCLEESSDDFVVAMCMLDGYSLEDEQEALDAYTVGLQRLLSVLGIS